MKTQKLISNFVSMGTRLVILVSMLVAAMINNAIPAAAAPPATLTALTLGAPSGTLTTGTAGSITYLVTVTKDTNNNNTSAFLSLSWAAPGAPAGVTTSFSPSSVSWTGTGTGGSGAKTSTLTINTTAATPAVTRNFTVRAQRSGSDFRTVGGALTVNAVLLTPTISFGPAPTPTFPGSNFVVSATTDSNGALTYSAVSGPCAFVSGAAFSTSGTGTCVVQASTAATSTYSAGSVQQSITISAGSGTVFDLYAVTGTASFPGVSPVVVWGYNTANTPVTQPGGPLLVVNQNDFVTIVLHNSLSENTALLFQGQNMIPDTTGAAAGGTKTYTFQASQPGTYLYEAGLRLNSQHQVAMGLYGALVVRPAGFPLAAPGQAYGDASTAFGSEQVLVLSEFDTALTASPNTPATFDMRKYAPKFFLINGKAYPNTDTISAAAGGNALLRYVNAGLQSHAMSLLGLTQTVIATDGNPFAYSHKMTAETIAPGQTLDAIITAPASTPDGSKFAIYDANMMLRNSTSAGLGGMLTFITVGTSAVAGPDTTGPLLSLLTLSPNPSTGAVSVALAFTANDTTTGNNNVTAAEYFIDPVGTPAAGTGIAIPVGSPAPVVSLNATIAAGLSAGTHLVTVRAQDALGNSSTANINLIVDNVGPTTSGLSLTPNPSNGTVTAALSFNASDSASGNSNVTAAEYWIDSDAHQPVTVDAPAPVKILNAIIPSGLSAGSHVIHARSQDALGNWGAEAPTINLMIDIAGPVTSSVSAAPNPNNGSKPFNTSIQAVRVSATFSDVLSGGSNISAAEGFLDAAGTTGTGFVFIPNDGTFNSPSEDGYADIPLVVVNTLSTGTHPLCIHAKDASGNWGAMNCAALLTIDRTAPTISSINRIGANPTNATSVQFLVTFSEAVTGLTSSNFTVVRTGLTGTSTITSVVDGGAAWTVTVTTGTGSGTIGINLTSSTNIADLAGNALSSTLPVVGQTFTILPASQPSIYFSTSGASNPPGVTGIADAADIYFYNTSTSAFTRSIDVTTITNPLPSGTNVDGFDLVSLSPLHFYMSFSSGVTISLPGPDLTVQDEDVVEYNAGTWSVFFDGTPAARGLSGSDLDAISIVGGTLYFSTDNTTVPAGVSGGGDDADIYSWNGTSFARVYDASALGWSTTNVDGFVRVDASHFYVSYSSDTTVPGSLSVQDEDIVYFNNGAWSVYFDGTAPGLTSSSLDIDAFDLP